MILIFLKTITNFDMFITDIERKKERMKKKERKREHDDIESLHIQ